MDITKKVEYNYNFEVSDIITNQKALCSLQATVENGVISLFVCGQPYERVKAELNPQVETACQEFKAELEKEIAK
jgi:hypothetical protein